MSTKGLWSVIMIVLFRLCLELLGRFEDRSGFFVSGTSMHFSLGESLRGERDWAKGSTPFVLEHASP